MTFQNSHPTYVKCPQCGQPSLFAPENEARPFCSERCKLIDLGEWASESYTIPINEPIDFEEFPEFNDSHNDSKDPSSDKH